MVSVGVIVCNATFNNISVISLWSVLLVEETSENHWPVSSHWQTLSLIKIHANMKIVTSELKFPWWCEIKYHGFIIIHVIAFFMNFAGIMKPRNYEFNEYMSPCIYLLTITRDPWKYNFFLNHENWYPQILMIFL